MKRNDSLSTFTAVSKNQEEMEHPKPHRNENENFCDLLLNLDLDQKVSSKLDVEWEVAFDCSRKIPINPKQTTWTLLNKEVKGDFLKIFANFK